MEVTDSSTSLLESIVTILGSDPLRQIERLASFEPKFAELTVAFKTLQKKTIAIERLVTEHTGIKSLSSTSDFETLGAFFQNASETKKSLELVSAETKALSSKISDLQAIQALEAETKATLYAALQKEISDKDANINSIQTLADALKKRLSETQQLVKKEESKRKEVEREFDTAKTDWERRALESKEEFQRLQADMERQKEDFVKERQFLEQNMLDASKRAAEETESQRLEFESQKKALAEGFETVKSELKSQSAALEEEIQQLKTDHEAKAKAWEEEAESLRQSLEAKTKTSDEEIEALKRELESLKNASQEEAEALRQSLDIKTKTSDEEIESLKRALETLQKKSDEEAESLRQTLDTKTKTSDEEIDRLQHALQSLQKSSHEEADSLQQSLEDKTKTLDEEIESLKRSLESQQTASQVEAESLRQSLEVKTKTSDEEIESLKRALEDQQKASQEETESLRQSLEVKTRDLNEEIESLKRALEDQQTASQLEAESLRQSLDIKTKTSDEEIGSLNRALEDQQKASQEETESLRQSLEAKTKTSVEEIESLKRALEDQQKASQEETDSLRQSLQIKTKTSGEEIESLKLAMESQQKASQEEANSLRHSLEIKTKTSVDEMERLQRVLESQRKTLQEQAESLKQSLDAKTMDSDEKIVRLQRVLETQRKTFEDEVASLRQSMEVKTKDSEEEIERLQQDLGAQKQASEDVIQGLKLQLDSRGMDAGLEIQGLRMELANKIKESELEIESLKNQLKSTTNELENKERLRSELETRMNQTLAQIQAVQSEHRNMEKEKNDRIQGLALDLDTKTKDFERECGRLQAEIESKTKEVASLSQRIVVLEQEHAKTEASLKLSHEKAIKAQERDLRTAKEDLLSKETIISEHLREMESLRQEKEELTVKLEAEKGIASKSSAERSTIETTHQKLFKQAADLETRNQMLETELLTAQEQASGAEAAMAELRVQLGKLRQQLTEEEEKKNKSIQLLRSSKLRIIKMEGELKAKEAESLKTHESLVQREREFLDNGRLVSELQTKTQDLSSQLEKLLAKGTRQAELLEQQKTIKARLDDLEGREKEYDLTKEENQKLTLELERVGHLHRSMEHDLKQWPERLSEYESRIDTLNAELDMSRRLFETKSIENDAFKVQVSELEAKMYSSMQRAKGHNDDLESLRLEVSKSRQESSERLKEVKALEVQMRAFRETSEASLKHAEERALELETRVRELSSLTGQLQDLEREKEQLLRVHEAEKKRLLELQAELDLIKVEQAKTQGDKDTLLTDLKMRQVQLQNINRALKEEVRRLSKSGSSPTSGASSPVGSRRNSVIGPTGTTRKESITLGGGSLISSPPGSERPTLKGSNSSLFYEGFPEPDPEYLKAVVLKFLESKDKRAQLLPVIGTILRFTPEELRRVKGRL